VKVGDHLKGELVTRFPPEIIDERIVQLDVASRSRNRLCRRGTGHELAGQCDLVPLMLPGPMQSPTPPRTPGIPESPASGLPRASGCGR
jgi:hypothetical protein